jgi:recombination protein RecT
MADETRQITAFRNEGDLKVVLGTTYKKQIENYFGDEKKALAFLSGVVAATQRLPELLKCSPVSVINSFMVMAQLGFMPSGVSGEAYVLPYKNKGVLEAQFQLGYQGLVTLFYRSGVKDIAAEIVYEKDFFEVENGKITHRPDVFAKDRGAAKGAYVIVRLPGGGSVTKAMSKEEILDIGKKFSKSFGGGYSPWDPKNDPQLWMWKKTVLKQVAKLVPKNESIAHAIAEDNKDSVIADRLEAAKKESESLSMGSLLKHDSKNGGDGVPAGEKEAGKAKGKKAADKGQDDARDAEGDEASDEKGSERTID